MSTTNHYINNPDFPYSGEQRLIEDLTVESIKFSGHTFLYIPRTKLNRDEILGDDLYSEFKESYELELYIQSVDGFGGNSEMINSFGYQMKDNAQLAMAKRRFFDLFRGNPKNPLEGDLLYFPLTKGLFEITFVQHENPFYMQGKIFVYTLEVQRFQYNQEVLNTGRIEIDNVGINFENDDDSSNDPFADNKLLGEEGEDLKGWSSENPFGDY